MSIATVLTVPLLLLLLCVQHIFSCQSNCCQSSSNCCQSSSDCCQTSSNCCQICQVRCTTNTCIDNCKNDCCSDKNCPTVPTAPPRAPDTPVDRPSGTQSNSADNRNNNTADFTATISLNNVINSENRIYVPINVTNHNFNNVVITSSGGGGSIDERPIAPTDRPTVTPYTEGKPVTVTVKVPVPIPVPGKKEIVYLPIPYPVAYPVPLPYPFPGCCVTVTPCVTDYCTPYHRICGQECSHRYMYRPVNPCESGCYKRQYTTRSSCFGPGYCQNNQVDCSNCKENFYLTYNGYQQCGGCYYA